MSNTQGFEQRSKIDRRGSEIERAFDLLDGFARNTMRIDHRGPDVAVAQKYLDRADVVIGLQKMRRERVPERVAGDSLGKCSLSDRDCFPSRVMDAPSRCETALSASGSRFGCGAVACGEYAGSDA